MISRCSAIVESFCGRTFARERVIETQVLDAPVLLMLSRTPVVTVHEVLVDAVLVATTGWSLATPDSGVLRFGRTVRHDEYMWRALGGPRLYDAPTYACPVAHSVEYTGGYLLPDDGNDGDLPPDLEHAVHLVVRGELDLRARGALGVTAERLGDASRSYAASGRDGSPGMTEARPILAHYKRLPL